MTYAVPGFCKYHESGMNDRCFYCYSFQVFRFSRLWPFWNYQLAIYEKIKFPLALIYGGFPSKLVTYIGDPIKTDDDDMDVVELNIRVQQSLQSLIQSKQPIPGSIFRAIWERFKPSVVETQ